MKEIKVTIPSDKIDGVKDLFDQLSIRYNIVILSNEVIFDSIVEDNQTTIVLEELKGIGVGVVYGRIGVTSVNLEIDSKSKKFLESARSISVDEMISNIKGLAIISPLYGSLCTLAGILASFGLIYDNVVIVIASMIIAPLLGPIALSVIGTMVPNNIYSKKAILTEVIGLSICIIIGSFVGFLFTNQVPATGDIGIKQITDRIRPGIPDIIFAIASGLAAGIFIIRGEATNIVGVAVAASLAPPAANVGVLLANARFEEALGSLILLFLNVISIYAACAIIFWTSQTLIRGGTVSRRQYKQLSRKYAIRISLAVLTLVLVIVVIVVIIPNFL